MTAGTPSTKLQIEQEGKFPKAAWSTHVLSTERGGRQQAWVKKDSEGKAPQCDWGWGLKCEKSLKRRKASNGEHVHNTEVPDEDRTWLDRGNAKGGDRPYSSTVEGEAAMARGVA